MLKNTDVLECGPMPNVMAAQPNVGSALCESYVIAFLVGLPGRKVWLTPLLECRAVTLPIQENARLGTQSEFWTWQNSIMGQDPPKMYI